MRSVKLFSRKTVISFVSIEVPSKNGFTSSTIPDTDRLTKQKCQKINPIYTVIKIKPNYIIYIVILLSIWSGLGI